MPPPHMFTAAVLGRYLGVVSVLEGLLVAGGIAVEQTWAADSSSEPPPVPSGAGVVAVVSLAPGDPTLGDLRARGWIHPVVAVTWHPSDELHLPPGPTSLVPAGTIRATLAAIVRTTATHSG